MGTYNIRLGSMLSFDEEQEKDLIKVMEYLNATHSTGKFISNLIRIALDNPEILDMNNGKFEKGAIIKQLETIGVSYNRNAFFSGLSKDVENMKKKVDKIYDMSMKTYMLAQMGKHLGLETKSDNSLMASFILEKQIKEIQDTLGISLGSSPFESSKLDVAHKRADDALEYIIETYDNILNELKSQFEVQKIEIPVQVASVVPISTTNNETVSSTEVTNNEPKPIVEETKVIEEDKELSDDDTIDFGDTPEDNFEITDALSGFFDSIS